MIRETQFKSLKEWRLTYPQAYVAAHKQGLIDKICASFGWARIVRVRMQWSKDDCIEDAKKYPNRYAWQKNSTSAYYTSRRNGWFEECTAHMAELQKPPNYWTLELCKISALNYKTKGEWQKNDNAASTAARKNGWLDECSQHMVEMKNPKGYWTKDRCLEEALKYVSASEWGRNSATSYGTARRNGWLEECSLHLVSLKKPTGYWTKERCIEEALKYKTISDWMKNSSTSRGTAFIKGWMNECTAHMVELQKPRGYWNDKDRCIEEAGKYSSKTTWRDNSSRSYVIAGENGWMDECIAHMVNTGRRKENGYWTKDRCLEEALKYNSKTEWYKSSNSSYQVAHDKGWMNECAKHMKPLVNPNGYWTKERCIEEALKYTTRSEFQTKGAGASGKAKKQGWYEECVAHMKIIFKPSK